jgi:hypothetical protein
VYGAFVYRTFVYEAIAAFPRYGCAENIGAAVIPYASEFEEQGRAMRVAVIESVERPENVEEKIARSLLQQVQRSHSKRWTQAT